MVKLSVHFLEKGGNVGKVAFLVLTNVGVFRSGETAIWSLGPPQTEFQELDVPISARSDSVASGIGCDKAAET